MMGEGKGYTSFSPFEKGGIKGDYNIFPSPLVGEGRGEGYIRNARDN